MLDLITTLRSMTAAGRDQYTVGGVTYWSDEQLQAALDSTRRYAHLHLVAIPTRGAGQNVYQQYALPDGVKWVENIGTGSLTRLMDAGGNIVPSNLYSINYYAGLVSFSADTGGIDYYLDASVYDCHHAAANVWQQKAGHYANRVDFKTDNHDIKASQEAAAARNMAAHYRELSDTLSGIRVSRLTRIDER
jgi:hypothetical protein